MPKFRIWTNTGEPQTIEADTVEFKRVPEVGLNIKLKTAGKKTVSFEGAICLTEVSEKIKGR